MLNALARLFGAATSAPSGSGTTLVPELKVGRAHAVLLIGGLAAISGGAYVLMRPSPASVATAIIGNPARGAGPPGASPPIASATPQAGPAMSVPPPAVRGVPQHVQPNAPARMPQQGGGSPARGAAVDPFRHLYGEAGPRGGAMWRAPAPMRSWRNPQGFRYRHGRPWGPRGYGYREAWRGVPRMYRYQPTPHFMPNGGRWGGYRGSFGGRGFTGGGFRMGRGH